MNCPTCGAQSPAGASSCPYCNTPLTGYGAPQQSYAYGQQPPAYSPPGAYASPSAPLKTGADLGVGIAYIIIGALEFFVLLLAGIAIISEYSSYSYLSYYSNAVDSSMVMGILLCLVLCLAGLFLLIGGIMACVKGRGNGLAITSGILNSIITLLILVAIIMVYVEYGSLASYAMPNSVWLMFIILLLVSVFTFVMLPVRKSARRTQVAAHSAYTLGRQAYQQPAPGAYPGPAAQPGWGGQQGYTPPQNPGY